MYGRALRGAPRRGRMPAARGRSGGAMVLPPYDTTAVQDAMYSLALIEMAPPNEYYLHLTAGSDSNDGRTEETAFRTLEHAVSQMDSGDHLVVCSTVITAGFDGWCAPLNGITLPDGISWARPTVIRAKNRFGTRINQATADYDGCIFDLRGSQNCMVDGFIINHVPANNPFPIELGDNNTLTRTGIRKTNTDTYGGMISYGSACVIEDCFGIGAARYGVKCGSSSNVNINNSCLRRIVVSYQFTGSNQPKASFAIYGADDPTWGNNPGEGICDICTFDCFDIDSPAFGSGIAEPRWASFLSPKSVRRLQYAGCGSINCGVAYGAFRSDNIAPADEVGHLLANDFVQGQYGDGTSNPPAFGGASDHHINFAEYCTGGPYSANYSGRTTHALTSGIVYPTQRVGGNGAEQLWQIGAFRSRFGDAGYDVPQVGRRRWPSPYQDEMAALMAETITKPSGYYPLATVTSSNPFAAMSFTERVWTAFGAEMPDLDTEVYA